MRRVRPVTWISSLGGKIRARNAQTAGGYTGVILVIAWYAGS